MHQLKHQHQSGTNYNINKIRKYNVSFNWRVLLKQCHAIIVFLLQITLDAMSLYTQLYLDNAAQLSSCNETK